MLKVKLMVMVILSDVYGDDNSEGEPDDDGDDDDDDDDGDGVGMVMLMVMKLVSVLYDAKRSKLYFPLGTVF